MRFRAVPPLLMFAALGGSGAAHAASDLLPGTVYCNSGQALKTCAAFQITTASDESGGRLVALLVRNLAGSHGADGAMNVVRDPPRGWSLGGSAPELGTRTFLARSGNPDQRGAIQRCTIVSNPSHHFQSCDHLYSGWVQFSFGTSERWYTSEGSRGDFEGGISLECDPGSTKPNCASIQEPPPSTPVPEPATAGLLATGLVALGVVGMRRRRKRA